MTINKLANGMLDLPHNTQAEITNRNAATSPLLRLPPEIRNLIYQSLFTGFRCTYSYDMCGRVYAHLQPRTVNALAVLLVCRETYAEAALVPISTMTVNMCVDWEDMSVILSKRLGLRQASVAVVETSINRVFRVPLEGFPGLRRVRLRTCMEEQMELWDRHKDRLVSTTGSDIVFEVENALGLVAIIWRQSDHGGETQNLQGQ